MSVTEQWIEYFTFLDELRLSGKVNMYGATPYIQERFAISEKEARSIWNTWQETFADEPAEVRAKRLELPPRVLSIG